MTQQPTNHSFDVIIVGGGMIGASLALALAPLHLKIAIVDAVAFGQSHQPSFDDRAIALSYGSAKIFKAIGLWPKLATHVAPIKHIHISERGRFGFCRLHAEDYRLDALGYVLENRVAGDIFYQALGQQSEVSLIAPAQVHSYRCDSQQAILELTLANNEKFVLQAPLIVAADGTHSSMARFTRTEHQQVDYDQKALILNMTCSKAMDGWAYERFTESGPLALLPLTRNRISVVWTFDPAEYDKLKNLSDDQLQALLQQRFGYRCGKIQRLGQRVFYPLSKRCLTRGYAPRVAFVGNALHTGHPVAGQGFNLGLRDVAQLADLIAQAHRDQQDIGDASLLINYWQRRQPDISQTLQVTDSLARLFANDNPVLSLSRNLALKWLDVLPPIKKRLAYQAMGLRHDLSALARGVPLLDSEH